MGIGGSVQCNCFKDGKYKPPPFPTELLYFDQDGRLSISEDENVYYKTEESLEYIFSEWKEIACEHRDMDYAYADLGNWDYYHSFIDSLKYFGFDEFPYLLNYLPHANNDVLENSLTVPMLNELNKFKKLQEIDSKVFLIMADKKERLYRINNENKHHISSAGKYGIYADAFNQEIFITNPNKEEIFRAKRFSQIKVDSNSSILSKILPSSLNRPIGNNKEGFSEMFEFTNLKTHQKIISPCGIVT